MQRLWDILLGVRRAAWAAGGGWRLEFLSLPRHDAAFALIVAIVVATAGVVYLYRREGRNVSPRMRWILSALRMIVLLGVLAMLLEPAIVFTKTEWVPANLLVLMDESQSMELPDAYVDPAGAASLCDSLNLPGGAAELRGHTRLWLIRRALDQGLLDKLAANGERVVHVRAFAGQLSPEGAAATTQPPAATSPASAIADRSTSALGTAIRQVVTAYRGQPVAGVLIISDGQSNSGESPVKAAESAAADGVPVVALAVGTPEGPRNAKLERLDASPVVFIRDPSTLRVIVTSRGLAKTPATVVLERRRDGGPWEEAGRQTIVLEESGQVQIVPFTFQEDRPTKLELRARLQDVGPELTEDDNVATADVRVIRDRIRVLFIAGSTFPEVEFLRNALLRDTGIAASTWLMAADPKYDQPGNPIIKRLPATVEELNDYDCIVLYDPDPSQWPDSYPQLLMDFVAKAGGGLIYVAGERMTRQLFDRPDDVSTSWMSMLPVVVEPGLYRSEVQMKLSAAEPWRLDISSEGKASPIFQFSEKPEINESILSNLPGMFWHFPVTRAKSGATILARHGDPRMRNEHGAHVLLATQLVGPGRTFFVAFDSTYRWRYLDEHYFDGFWARMIDRAGRSKQLGGRYPYSLSTDRASYKPGEQVTLTARFENPADRDAGLETMHGEVEVSEQPVTPIALEPRKGEAGVFETTFTVTKPGTHFVRVWAGDQDVHAVARAATLQVPVELPNLEYERPTLDLTTLQSIADVSRGAVFSLAQADHVSDAFKVKRVARVLEDRQPIWNAPLIFGTVLLTISIEWILRKRVRLV